MQVLELVHSRELLHIETIGQNAVGLPLQQVLTLKGRNVRDRREDIGTVRSSPLNAVTVVDATLSGLGVYIKVLQIVVEIDGAGTEVATKESSVGREDGGQIHVTLLGQGEGHTR